MATGRDLASPSDVHLISCVVPSSTEKSTRCHCASNMFVGVMTTRAPCEEMRTRIGLHEIENSVVSQKDESVTEMSRNTNTRGSTPVKVFDSRGGMLQSNLPVFGALNHYLRQT